MIRFFGKQDKETLDPIEIRLRSLDRKLNFVLVMVALQLLISFVSFARATLVPSTLEIALFSVLLIGGLWLFRRPLISFVKRKVLRDLLDKESATSSAPHGHRASNAGRDNSIV